MKNLTNLSKKLLATLLATLLAALLCVSLLPVGALADEDAEINWEESSITITTVDELEQLASKVNEGNNFNGKTITLGNDLDLQGKEWTPIGIDSNHPFKGIFDGQNHTIRNLSVSSSNSNVGLFGYVGGDSEAKILPEIKNLTVENVHVSGVNSVGGVIGNVFVAAVTNVHVTGTVDIEGSKWVGGIVGYGYVKINSCSVEAEGNIKGNVWCVGGILGYAGEGTSSIVDSSVAGTGDGLTLFSTYSAIGGIAGQTAASGSQHVSGSNLSVSNVKLESSQEWANTYPGYFFGGTFSHELTGALKAENVTVEVAGESVVIHDVVATVDGKYYTTLQEAINACTEGNETVTLLTDVTESVTVAEGQNITLDLNGKTLTGVKNDKGEMKDVVTNNGTLTIKDSSDNKSGVIMGGTDTGEGTAGRKGIAVVNEAKATCTIEGGNIKRGDNNTFGNYTVQNKGKMYIKGGNVTNNSKNSNLVVNYGYNAQEKLYNLADVYMEISGGHLQQDAMGALKNDPNTTMKITGDAMIVREAAPTNYAFTAYGTVVMDGGTIKGGSIMVASHGDPDNQGRPAHMSVSGDAKLDLTGKVDVIQSYSNIYTEAEAKFTVSETATVNGGIVRLKGTVKDNDQGGTVYAGTVSANENDNVKVSISGGTFNNEVPAEYCADNFVPKTNSDGTYGVTEKVPVTGVTLNQTTASLYSNTTPNTVTLTATVAPENTTDDTTVTWISSNENVAKVDANGVVTSTGNGTATITATVGNVSATCNVTVSTYTYVPSYGGGGGGTTIVDPDVPLDPRPWLFTDVPEDAWYYDAVHSVFMSFYMNGESDTIFNPTGKTNRAMMAQIVCNLDESFIELPSDFTDVAEGAWYAGAVGYAASIEVVTGYGGTTRFGPDDPVTREQIALMLYRLANAMEFDTTGRADLSGYTDSASVSTWAQEAMQWAVSAGVITGSNNELRPQADAMRCEIAQMIDNFTAEYFPAEEE